MNYSATVKKIGTSMTHDRAQELYDMFREWSDDNEDKSHCRAVIQALSKQERTYLYAQAMWTEEFMIGESKRDKDDLYKTDLRLVEKYFTLAEVCKEFGIDKGA